MTRHFYIAATAITAAEPVRDAAVVASSRPGAPGSRERAWNVITKMNQWALSDSGNSLDADSRIGDSIVMIAQPYQLYIERTDPSKNMARFYAMTIEPTLFGDVCLTRRWGRIGAQGQVMKHSFPREEEAVGLFLGLLRQKRHRGYHPKGRRRDL